MTCPDCARLQLENTRLIEETQNLQRENTELRRRLTAYENPHTPPAEDTTPPAEAAEYHVSPVDPEDTEAPPGQGPSPTKWLSSPGGNSEPAVARPWGNPATCAAASWRR